VGLLFEWSMDTICKVARKQGVNTNIDSIRSTVLNESSFRILDMLVTLRNCSVSGKESGRITARPPPGKSLYFILRKLFDLRYPL
jgi:hypothetical protein